MTASPSGSYSKNKNHRAQTFIAKNNVSCIHTAILKCTQSRIHSNHGNMETSTVIFIQILNFITMYTSLQKPVASHKYTECIIFRIPQYALYYRAMKRECPKSHHWNFLFCSFISKKSTVLLLISWYHATLNTTIQFKHSSCCKKRTSPHKWS
jgi:hypothetical protein